LLRWWTCLSPWRTGGATSEGGGRLVDQVLCA
jgi:hypothetical protein